MILSGSVGLEPLLAQAGLSAHANIFSPYDLRPWDEEIAVSCLFELAGTYEIDLSREISLGMCRRLRCCVPHHVQMYFDKLLQHLRRAGRCVASDADAESVYRDEMLSVRGQLDLQHYENRLLTVLGTTGYPVAMEILTETAVNDLLSHEAVDSYRHRFPTGLHEVEPGVPTIENVLHVLVHDGYLERRERGYRFTSGLLEDWWRHRWAGGFRPAAGTGHGNGGTER